MSDETPGPEVSAPAASPVVPPKASPDGFVLRGHPGRVVRFRRGVIIAIAGIGSTAIVGVAWVALKPVAFDQVAPEPADEKSAADRAPDALAKAPKSYAEVPVLGLPLPGDLGRPILAHQRSLDALSQGQPSGAAGQGGDPALAQEQKRLAERQAARESGVLVQLAGAGRSTGAAAVDPPLPNPSAEGSETQRPKELDPERDPGSQLRKAGFLATPEAGQDINPHRIVEAGSPWTLSAGSVIAASLITGLNSDLPGFVTAQVTEGVYDSVTGRTLLIPQGARIVGSYDSVIAFGQQRALVVWNRIILPDGASIRIDNLPATDTAGYAGLSDNVDRHTWQLLKGVVLSTLLGVGTELSLNDESDLVRAVRESAQTGAARAGDRIVLKNLDVQPTITVRPGWPLRVMVHKDLLLRPWNGTGGRL